MEVRLIKAEAVFELLPPEMGKLHKLRNIAEITQRITNIEVVQGVTFNGNTIEVLFHGDQEPVIAAKENIESILKQELI